MLGPRNGICRVVTIIFAYSGCHCHFTYTTELLYKSYHKIIITDHILHTQQLSQSFITSCAILYENMTVHVEYYYQVPLNKNLAVKDDIILFTQLVQNMQMFNSMPHLKAESSVQLSCIKTMRINSFEQCNLI